MTQRARPGKDGTALGKLLRFRQLEEDAAEAELVQARAARAHATQMQTVLQEGGCQLQRARLDKLAQGDWEASMQEEQSWPPLRAAIERIVPWLAMQERRATLAAMTYAEAHRERQKLELLLEAEQQRRRKLEEKREQRALDDRYLAARQQNRARVSGGAK